MSYQRASAHVNSVGPVGEYIADTAAHPQTDPPFRYLLALQDSVIASATSVANACPSGTLTNIELPAGVIFPGRFTSVTLASGAIVGYIE